MTCRGIITAVSGKIDTLQGLKENVIIGRLIPAGKRDLPSDEMLHESDVAEEEEAAVATE